MHGLGSSLSCTTSMQDMPSFVFIVALVDGHACSCLASDKAANTLPEYHYEVNRCKRRLAIFIYLFIYLFIYFLVLLTYMYIHHKRGTGFCNHDHVTPKVSVIL